MPAARVRLPVVRHLRRPRLVVRLRPLRRPPERQRQGRMAALADPGARGRRCPRLGDHPQPARSGSPPGTSPDSRIRSSTAERASCASAPTSSSRAPAASGPRSTLARSPDCDLTEPREFNLMFETFVGPVREDASRAYLASRDGAGHLRQLQERHLVDARQAAVRHRTDRQELPQRDHARQLPLPHARVRADGDGVLRPAGRGRRVAPLLDRRSAAAGTSTSACASRTCASGAHEAAELSHYSSATSDIEYLYPIGWLELEGRREPRRLRPAPAHRGVRDDARVDRSRGALRPVRDRAGDQRRPLDPRVSLRRLRRRGGRRPAAHPACGCTRASHR